MQSTQTRRNNEFSTPTFEQLAQTTMTHGLVYLYGELEAKYVALEVHLEARHESWRSGFVTGTWPWRRA